MLVRNRSKNLLLCCLLLCVGTSSGQKRRSTETYSANDDIPVATGTVRNVVTEEEKAAASTYDFEKGLDTVGRSSFCRQSRPSSCARLNSGQKRRSTETYSASVDIDAATGTFRNVVTEEEKAAASTCDEKLDAYAREMQANWQAIQQQLKEREEDKVQQMRQLSSEYARRIQELQQKMKEQQHEENVEAVLVKSKEMAQQEQKSREKLSTQDETTKGLTAEAKNNMEEKIQAAEAERDSVKEKHEKAVDRITGLEKSVQELNEQISSLESSHKSQVDQVVQDKDTEIAELTSKLMLSRDDFQKELETKIQHLRDQSEASLKGKDEQMHQVSLGYVREMQALQQKMKEREETFEAILVKSKEMAQQEQKSREKLSTQDETTKGLTAEAKNNMEEKIQAAEAERDSVKEKHEKAVDRITGLEKSVQELNEQISSLESSHKSQVDQVQKMKEREEKFTAMFVKAKEMAYEEQKKPEKLRTPTAYGGT